MHCNVCMQDAPGEVERARVRSNVRKWSGEQFAVWRCPHCLSIHATDEVDLAHYYADYPFHKLSDSIGWMLRVMYKKQISRLRAAGVTSESRILDYGCGSGLLLAALQDAGFGRAVGFDEYSERFADRKVLTERYDCRICMTGGSTTRCSH